MSRSSYSLIDLNRVPHALPSVPFCSADSPRDACALRQWFRRSRIVGSACGSSLWSRSVPGARSTGAAATALRAEGEERHLPVHGRWAEPDGYLRSKAGSDEVSRQADACQGAADAVQSE